MTELWNSNNICINWKKPNGGDEIKNFILDWMVQSKNITLSHAVPYRSTSEIYTFTIENLLEGEKINISIQSSNSAGLSNEVKLNSATGKQPKKSHYLLQKAMIE